MAQRAKEIALHSVAPENFTASYLSIALGNALAVNGQFALARAELQSVVEADVRALGKEGVAAADALLNIGEILRAEGHPVDALVAYRRSGQILDAQTPENPYRVAVQVGLAEAHLQAGQPHDALTDAQRALELCQKIHCGVLRPVALTTLGLAQLATGSTKAARTTLEQSVDLSVSGAASEVDLARARFALAQALLRSGERDKAFDLARSAAPALEQRKDYIVTSRQLQAFLAQAP